MAIPQAPQTPMWTQTPQFKFCGAHTATRPVRPRVASTEPSTQSQTYSSIHDKMGLQVFIFMMNNERTGVLYEKA